jgi:hypothetical protein
MSEARERVGWGGMWAVPRGETERGSSLGAGGRRKHVTEGSAHSESPEPSELGLSPW